MIFSLFRKAPSPIPGLLYEAVMRASRRPELFRGFHIPDTPQGRFEMVVIHACLFLKHAKNHPELTELTQDFVDLLFDEFDRAMRELGVGDMSVPRRMKKLASAVYGRFSAYEAALAIDDLAILAQSLQRNITFIDDQDAPLALAHYLQAADRDLGLRFDPVSVLAGAFVYLSLTSM